MFLFSLEKKKRKFHLMAIADRGKKKKKIKIEQKENFFLQVNSSEKWH